jgi:hypothetical protein
MGEHWLIATRTTHRDGATYRNDVFQGSLADYLLRRLREPSETYGFAVIVGAWPITAAQYDRLAEVL